MEQYPRLLIICHNLYDDTNNIGKTLVSLLNGWPIEKLAQINFKNDIPSFIRCKKYYSITDKDVALSVMTFGIHKVGKKLLKANQILVSDTEKNLYRFGNKRIPLVSFIRDTMWGLGTWKNKELKKWVEQYDPEAILFVPNDYVLAYRVALFIEKRIKRVPLIPYYMDDSFYYDCETSGIDYVRRLQLRKKAKQVHSYALSIFTICNKMSRRYERQFGIPCTDYMNSIKPGDFSVKNVDDKNIIFSYIGNLHSNRWRCLVEIGKALEKVSKKTKSNIEFRIYSASNIGTYEISVLKAVSCIRLMGSVLPSEVQKKQREADILVHVEAFDKRSKNSTMYSLSTKIPEYMNAGVSIFAYGPSDIASIEYLKENDIAFVCDKKEKLEDILYSAIVNKNQREKYIQQGILLAREKHNIEKASKRFINSIISCWKMGVGDE